MIFFVFMGRCLVVMHRQKINETYLLMLRVFLMMFIMMNKCRHFVKFGKTLTRQNSG